METYHLTSAQDNVTGEYRQVRYISMQDQTSWLMRFWMLAIITVLTAFAFSFLARNFGKLPTSFRVGLPELAIGLVVFLGTFALQGWMHVLVLRRYGARPKFGLFRNNAIAYISIPDYGLRRNTVIVAALTPLVLLTGVALLGIWLFQGTQWVALFALIAVLNVAAATSNLWTIAILLRYPSSAWTVDDGDGMRILMPM